jgi:hypothetical protein
MGPHGTIGSHDWHAAGNTGAQPGWTSHDMNIDFPPVELPYEGGLPPRRNVRIDGEMYDYVFDDGDYVINTGQLRGAILVRGTARVVVNVNINIAGAGSGIYIEEGASFRLYANTPSAALGGNGVQNPGLANQFYYFGLPINTRIDYRGNSEFTGVFYAPNADFRLSGGGSNTENFTGAAIARDISLTGNWRFHYDEGLQRIGLMRSYIVNLWQEI